MAVIQIKLPDDLYEQLVATAERENWTIEEIVIAGITREIAAVGSPIAPLTREEEQRRLREAMKGRIWDEEDVEQLFPWLDEHPMSDEEVERIVAAIPPLDPPLSQTVIQMREEERY